MVSDIAESEQCPCNLSSFKDINMLKLAKKESTVWNNLNILNGNMPWIRWNRNIIDIGIYQHQLNILTSFSSKSKSFMIEFFSVKGTAILT